MIDMIVAALLAALLAQSQPERTRVVTTPGTHRSRPASREDDDD